MHKGALCAVELSSRSEDDASVIISVGWNCIVFFQFSLKVFNPQTLFQTCISFHKDVTSELIIGLDLSA